MFAFKFDKDTKEYLGEQKAQKNPLAPGYLLPANSTFDTPPTVQNEQVACYIDGHWIVYTDKRGSFQVNLDNLEVTTVDYIGDAEQGFQFITDEQAEKFAADPDAFKIINGVFTDISDTEEYQEIKASKREIKFEKEFFNTSLGWIRRSVNMSVGGTKDFLSDLLPTISLGVSTGQTVKIIAYTKPSFDEDITDWTQYQSFVDVTPQFVQECFQQLSNDFLPVNEEV